MLSVRAPVTIAWGMPIAMLALRAETIPTWRWAHEIVCWFALLPSWHIPGPIDSRGGTGNQPTVRARRAGVGPATSRLAFSARQTVRRRHTEAGGF